MAIRLGVRFERGSTRSFLVRERVLPLMRILKQLTAAEKWIIVLSGLTLALAVRNLGRAIVAVRYTTTLPDLPMTAPLSYFAAMGGFWSIVFLACTMGLSSFRRWARWATLTGVTIYQSNVWFNHLLL